MNAINKRSFYLPNLDIFYLMPLTDPPYHVKIYGVFSIIQQDFVCYQLSLRENIALGSPDDIADNLHLLDSSKLAEALNIVERVGLDAQFG